MGEEPEPKGKISRANAAEYGRRGGSMHTDAQRQQRSKARQQAIFFARQSAYEGAAKAVAKIQGEGWTQQRTARVLGVSPSTISRWLKHPPVQPSAPGWEEEQ